MVAAPCAFLEVEEEAIFAHAAEFEEAAFGVAPKAFDPIDVVFAARPTAPFAPHPARPKVTLIKLHRAPKGGLSRTAWATTRCRNNAHSRCTVR